jgi:hypothetical protein
VKERKKRKREKKRKKKKKKRKREGRSGTVVVQCRMTKVQRYRRIDVQVYSEILANIQVPEPGTAYSKSMLHLMHMRAGSIQ